MIVSDALNGVTRLYLDTAPLIYYIEDHPTYGSIMAEVMRQVDERDITIVTSVITLTEVLVKPLEAGHTELAENYQTILRNADHTELYPVSSEVAEEAARLRAELNLRTPDALHIASAIKADCDALLTNDSGIKRVSRPPVVLLSELEIRS